MVDKIYFASPHQFGTNSGPVAQPQGLCGICHTRAAFHLGPPSWCEGPCGVLWAAYHPPIDHWLSRTPPCGAHARWINSFRNCCGRQHSGWPASLWLLD